MDNILLLVLFTCILTRYPEISLEVIKTLKFHYPIRQKNIKFYINDIYIFYTFSINKSIILSIFLFHYNKIIENN